MRKNCLQFSALILAAVAIIFAGCYCSRSQGGKKSIQIKGSDTMVNLGQAWAEEYMKKFPDQSVAVTGGGSGTGITAMINKTCDIAEVSRPMKQSEIQQCRSHGVEPNEIRVALDGLAVVINPQNKIDKLTLPQLGDIFSGKIKNWQELGGHEGQIVLLSREVNSGTHVYFKEHVLRSNDPNSKNEFAAEALMLPSSQAIADEVAQNINAIGYYGMGYLSEKQKAVAIAKDANSPFFPPTIENVQNNQYPISRPLFMYTKGKPAGAVANFINYILSEEGQKIVSRIDFVPIII